MKEADEARVEELFLAVVAIESKIEARSFLRDLLTEAELIEFGKRLRAARMLHEGFLYADIINETGLSSTTVARVSKWLHAGKGGYERILQRIKINKKD